MRSQRGQSRETWAAGRLHGTKNALGRSQQAVGNRQVVNRAVMSKSVLEEGGVDTGWVKGMGTVCKLEGVGSPFTFTWFGDAHLPSRRPGTLGVSLCFS